MAGFGRKAGRFEHVRSFIDELYGQDLHAKRIDSLAAATLGTMTAASLAVALIGQALAQAHGLKTKHAIKQVNRLLSNDGIDVVSPAGDRIRLASAEISLLRWTGPISTTTIRRRWC